MGRNRLLNHLQVREVDPERIREACEHIFGYLDSKGFSLREIGCLTEAITFAANRMTAKDPFRKVGEFDYSESLRDSFSRSADS